MNSVFYSSNMLQLTTKPVLSSFAGSSMKKDDLKEYVNKIKAAINDDTVPEFGNFAPINVNMVFKDDNAVAFQVKPSKQNREKKELTISFINAETSRLASTVKLYSDKGSLLKYIDTMDETKLKNMLEGFEADTNGN